MYIIDMETQTCLEQGLVLTTTGQLLARPSTNRPPLVFIAAPGVYLSKVALELDQSPSEHFGTRVYLESTGVGQESQARRLGCFRC